MRKYWVCFADDRASLAHWMILFGWRSKDWFWSFDSASDQQSIDGLIAWRQWVRVVAMI